MFVWISLAILLIIIYLCMGSLNTPKKRKKYLQVAGGLIALVMALRGDHGGFTYDFRVYTEAFETIANTPWSNIFDVTDFEDGYVLLCKLLSYIWDNSQTIIIFQSVFCVYAVCSFIYNNTEHVFESLFFFVTLGLMGFMLTGIRQAIAIALVLLSVKYIKEHRLIPFLIFVLLATSMHLSAFTFILAYFFANIKAFQNNKYLCAFVSIITLIFADKLINFGADFIYQEEWEITDAVFSFNGIVNVLIYAVSLIYQFLQIKRNSTSEKHICFSMSTLAFSLYMMRYFALSMERVALYFNLALLIGLSDLYYNIKGNKKGPLWCVIVITMCLVLYVRRMSGADYGNYTFFWM